MQYICFDTFRGAVGLKEGEPPCSKTHYWQVPKLTDSWFKKTALPYAQLYSFFLLNFTQM